MLKHIALAAVAAVALVQGLTATAEPSTRIDGFTIYHNAVNADTLSPDVARALGIQRSKARGVLNVSVIKDQAGTPGTPVSALVDVVILDAADQRTPVPMREIEAQGAVSYLGQFPIANGQELVFELKVRPAGVTEPTIVRMAQEFFIE